MKPLIVLPLSLFLVGCVCPLPKRTSGRPLAELAKSGSPQESAGTYVADRDLDIGTPEQIKSYSVGRYVDPADPNTLHERHTVYRREQNGYWNLAAAGGAGASRSYYLTADKTQQSQEQQAYYEAVQEQARVAKEKLVNAEHRVAVLEKENLILKEKTRPSRIYEPIQQP
jgi:hypothetical protein